MLESDEITAILNALDFSPTQGPEAPSALARLEAMIGVPLPLQYREFMLSIGGGYVEAYAPCTELTPFGRHSLCELATIDDVIDVLDSKVVPRNMISIGIGHGGAVTALSVAGLDHGAVFAVDTEMRFFWDFDIKKELPDLDPSIVRFFELRDADQSPQKPWGYDNCYRIASSFYEFLSKLVRYDDS